MRIALIVDNPFRDLSGLVLTGMFLCQLGCRCYLVPMNLQNWEVWPLAPDFVLLNYLRVSNEDFVRHLINAGIRVGVLETEGLTTGSLETLFEKLIAADTAVRERVSLYCSWGPASAELVARRGWFRAERTQVTGCPRFEFYAAPWREAALKSSAHIDRFPRPIILVNGNFSLANPAFQTRDQEVSMHIDRFNMDEAVVRGYLERNKEGMTRLTQLVNRLAAQFEDVTFIYRPNPFEKMETYDDLIQSRANLHVKREGTVDGWVLRAAAVIQCGCTTSVDAGFAGVPSITPSWIPNAHPIPEFDAVSLACGSEDELFDLVGKAADGSLEVPDSVRTAPEKTIREWFYLHDGRAGERVAQATVAALERYPASVSRSYCEDAMHGLFNPGPRWKKRIRIFASKALKRSPHWSFRKWRDNPFDLASWDRSGKAFGVEEVRWLVDSTEPSAQQLSADTWRRVTVSRAEEPRDYRLPNGAQRSVVISALPTRHHVQPGSKIDS